jgi:hypothetical protein
MVNSCARIGDKATPVWHNQQSRKTPWLFYFDEFRIGGVEIGQILFVHALLVAFFLLRPLLVRLLRSARDGDVHWSVVTLPASFVIGIVASYWMMDRISGFWS